MQLDIDHLKSWIGREDTAEEDLTPALVARFNATLDRTGPTERGAEAPQLVHLCLCQPAVPTAELGPDGHPARGGFLPPVPLPRRMWAGGEMEFHAPLRIGETITRRSVIDDVAIKEGRSGTLCFVTVRHSIESGGRLALTERQDIVYRDAATGTPAPSKPATDGGPVAEHSRPVTATAPLLFRYSALTFNSHRIHYDAPYCEEEEHYPDLVIHGPLQATMLCHYAADLRGSLPRRFRFRSLAPVFGPGTLTLNATDEGAALKLWTAQAGVPVSMEATADW